VAEQKLDLFNFPTGNMAEPGAGAPQVVRRNLVNAEALRETPNDVPDHFFGYFPKRSRFY
jgi:hypothetical protein